MLSHMKWDNGTQAGGGGCKYKTMAGGGAR